MYTIETYKWCWLSQHWAGTMIPDAIGGEVERVWKESCFGKAEMEGDAEMI